MAQNNRDDFTDKTKQLLKDRVGGLCSKSDCQVVTIGAATDPDKTASIGVAAHITAAAEGDPRYDPALTAAKRKHHDNGIWLCQSCSRLIDVDDPRFPVELLKQWKTQAEQLARSRIDTNPNQADTSQSIENVQGIGQNSGSINNPAFNFGTQGDQPKKS